MYRSVYELNNEELNELRESYYYQLYECDDDVLKLEDGTIIECAEDISMNVIYEHYNGISFTEDDFWCNL